MVRQLLSVCRGDGAVLVAGDWGGGQGKRLVGKAASYTYIFVRRLAQVKQKKKKKNENQQ